MTILAALLSKKTSNTDQILDSLKAPKTKLSGVAIRRLSTTSIGTTTSSSNAPSAQKALAVGLNVVMDACIKVEYYRLGIGRLKIIQVPS